MPSAFTPIIELTDFYQVALTIFWDITMAQNVLLTWFDYIPGTLTLSSMQLYTDISLC